MARFFINRPIVAMVIAIITVIVGVVSLLGLPTAQFPDIVPPEIWVQATYPGADAQTLVQSVATPLEQQITGVDNMNYMYSTNANNGQTQITVDFNVKTNPGYRSGSDAAPYFAGAVSVAAPGEHCRSDGAKVPDRSVDVDRALLAAQHLRQHFSCELRLHQLS